ncbi:unnamed protein product [Pleuronectes platessa]|uniref:Uncharacterized protein n=1 Tax=Pleuronectes platessa TaxID=8262 RepID=A0A9N7THC3_PLEPL|nr:unnamed protein product [Pleuronectes platessa]
MAPQDMMHLLYTRYGEGESRFSRRRRIIRDFGAVAEIKASELKATEHEDQSELMARQGNRWCGMRVTKGSPKKPKEAACLTQLDGEQAYRLIPLANIETSITAVCIIYNSPIAFNSPSLALDDP